MPAAVSQAGTNAAMPSTGMTRCDSQLNPLAAAGEEPDAGGVHQDVDRDQHDHQPRAHHREGPVGVYFRPSASVTATVMTKATRMLSIGDRCFGLTTARKRGNAPIRPIAYAVRLDTFTPALALAMVELTIARNTKNQKIP